MLYVPTFIFNDKPLFILETENIKDCCYKAVKMTRLLEQAKKYNDFETAKADVMQLRYYHREFLKVAAGIFILNDFNLVAKYDYIAETNEWKKLENIPAISG